MYESHFGFSEKPFSLLPDPFFFYQGKRHADALAMLEYGILGEAGFVLLTGSIGCGKTTLIRYLLDKIEDQTVVGVLSNLDANADDILQWVLMAFGLDYRGKGRVECYEVFLQFLIEQYAGKRRVLLIVDEAQHMNVAALERVRMLANVNVDKHQILQIVLVGHPSLREKLTRPELVQFAQRIVVDCNVEPLNACESREYVRFRLAKVGGNTGIFPLRSIDCIHDAAEGVPRLLNLLCDAALVYAYAEDRKRLSLKLVQEVIDDRREGGLFNTGGEVHARINSVLPVLNVPYINGNNGNGGYSRLRGQGGEESVHLGC